MNSGDLKPFVSSAMARTRVVWKTIRRAYYKKKVLYEKFYDTPAKFHTAITDFFQTVNEKHKGDLKKLLTLNFQFFENIAAEIYHV